MAANTTEQSGIDSVSELILPSLGQQDNIDEESVAQLTPLHENNLSFAGKSTRLHRETEENQGRRHELDAKTDTSDEIVCPTLSTVTTIGSDMFERSSTDMQLDTISGETSILTAQSNEYHPTTTSVSCLATGPDAAFSTQNPITEIGLNQKNLASEMQTQPKKRRGGWPKGKKRKKYSVELNKPKTPVAGYVRFINSRRPDVKTQYPNLPSLQITKIIGAEWNTMSTAEKQVYHNEAEEDKKRYLEELAAYQQTEAYQQFLKRQQIKKLKDFGVEGLDTGFLAENFDEGDDTTVLYCKLCNQHFSSEHNKKEHMLGRQHLQMITNEFEKDTQTMLKHKPAQLENVEKVEDETLSPTGELSEPTKLNTLSDVMETLVQHNYDREMEIRVLRKTLGNWESQRMLLCQELEHFKKLVLLAEESLNATKLLGSTLNNQLDDLRVVPSLFGVMI